jgi:hypothetical protein
MKESSRAIFFLKLLFYDIIYHRPKFRNFPELSNYRVSIFHHFVVDVFSSLIGGRIAQIPNIGLGFVFSTKSARSWFRKNNAFLRFFFLSSSSEIHFCLSSVEIRMVHNFRYVEYSERKKHPYCVITFLHGKGFAWWSNCFTRVYQTRTLHVREIVRYPLPKAILRNAVFDARILLNTTARLRRSLVQKFTFDTDVPFST